MDFSTLSSQSFQLCVFAPNGECSQPLQFIAYGDTNRFSPRMPGCGHGDWTFELTIAANGKQQLATTTVTEKIYLDGVGSLFFTVDERMQIRLSSQEFLRMPSASRNCSHALTN